MVSEALFPDEALPASRTPEGPLPVVELRVLHEEDAVVEGLPHHSHLKGFSPLWTRWWRCSFSVKGMMARPHSLHMCGLLTVN